MFGLPDDFDASFFVGAVLLQICIGFHEVVLRFDRDVQLTFEGNVRVSAGAEFETFERPPDAGAALVAALQQRVSSASGLKDGTLSLEFDTVSLVVLDSEERYESYQIQHGDEVIVV